MAPSAAPSRHSFFSMRFSPMNGTRMLPIGFAPVNPAEKEKGPAGMPEPLSCAGGRPEGTAQSSCSTFTILWSWLLPTQNVVGVVELSTNTVRMLVSDGIRYCTALPVLGSSRTTRSVLIVEAQSSPFLSKLARYGNVNGGRLYSARYFSVLVSNSATLLVRYSVTRMRSWSSICMRRARAFGVGVAYHVTCNVFASILPRWPSVNSAIQRLFLESAMT